MPYLKNYMTAHDIDWYACINGKWIVASSMGGLLPEKINNDSFLPILQTISYNLPFLTDKEEIFLNEELIRQRFERARRIYREYYANNEEMLELFLEHYTYEYFRHSYSAEFIEMARRGFITFIRFNIDDISDNRYTFVAKPSDNISEILKNTMDSPIPLWLDNPQFRSYLSTITLNAPDNDIQDPDINIWSIVD